MSRLTYFCQLADQTNVGTCISSSSSVMSKVVWRDTKCLLGLVISHWLKTSPPSPSSSWAVMLKTSEVLGKDDLRLLWRDPRFAKTSAGTVIEASVCCLLSNGFFFGVLDFGVFFAPEPHVLQSLRLGKAARGAGGSRGGASGLPKSKSKAFLPKIETDQMLSPRGLTQQESVG